MFRKTYAKIDGEVLENNIKEIKKKYSEYKYYIGVVKNNCYQHGIKCVNDLIRGGINYLAVSSLEEALNVRKYNGEIPVLCLEPIEIEYLFDALNNNITITIDSLEYLKKALELDLSFDLKVHLAIDSGMHRLGFDCNKSLEEAVKLIKEKKHLVLEGIYSHFGTSGIADPYYDRQVDRFLELTKNIDLKSIPIIHMGRSLSLVEHEKLDFCNGIRLGIIMFGFNQSIKKDNSLRGKIKYFKRKRLQKKYGLSTTYLENDLKLETAFSLYSTIISKRKVDALDLVGYGTSNKVLESGYIYTLPVGYADGVTKDFGHVVLKGECCPIMADCMDMIMIYSKNSYKLGEEVLIIGKERSISSLTKRLGINAYHLFNQISNRVVRVHVNGDTIEEIKY